MSKKTIIFLSGFCIPVLLAKSKLFWNKSIWSNYNCVFICSKTPTSDKMIKKELNRLKKITNSFDKPIIAGHSLGAWWITNLIKYKKINIDKAVFLTPLTDLSKYPNVFFNTFKYNIFSKCISEEVRGPHKNLIIYGSRDFVTPMEHGEKLLDYFNGTGYKLNGGHLYQNNHKYALQFMKDWIEIE